MLNALIAAIWITYLAILGCQLIIYNKIQKAKKSEKALMATLETNLQALHWWNLKTTEDKQKIAHQWMLECTETGIKTPFQQFLTNKLKEAPYA